MAMATLRTTLMVILALDVFACAEPVPAEQGYLFKDDEVDGELMYTRSRGEVANPTTMTGGSFYPFGCFRINVPCTQPTVAYYRLDVRFDLPAAPGVYALEDLTAVVCEAESFDGRERCSGISGSLSVTKLSAPCEGGACGEFEGVLTIAPAKDGSRAVIQGSVDLHYSERIHTIQTWEGKRSGGCNGQGG